MVVESCRWLSKVAARATGFAGCYRGRIALQGFARGYVCIGMDELDIVLALLESELADDTIFDETFDLERDDTREVTVVIEFDDQWTQPYELGRAPERCA